MILSTCSIAAVFFFAQGYYYLLADPEGPVLLPWALGFAALLFAALDWDRLVNRQAPERGIQLTVRVPGKYYLPAAAALAVIGSLFALAFPAAHDVNAAQWIPGIPARLAAGFGLAALGVFLLFLYAARKQGSPWFTFRYQYILLLSTSLAAFAWWSGEFLHMNSGGRMFPDEGRCYCLFDDAMVSMRYAWNLAHGHGLVWNLGERVEGYTNLLMTLLMSAGAFFFSKGATVLYVHVLGAVLAMTAAVFLSGAAVLMGRESRRQYSDLMAVLAALMMLFYYPMGFWSLLGMETSLLTLCAGAAVYFAFRADSKQGMSLAFPLFSALAVLTRPDAVVQISFIFLYRLWRLSRRGELMPFLKEAALFALFPLGLTVFRLAYYGEFLPNTYYLKMTGLPVWLRIETGIGFLGRFLATVWPLLCLGLYGLTRKFTMKKLLAALLFLSTCFYQVWTGGDAWPYWRIMTPQVFWLFYLALEGLMASWDDLGPVFNGLRRAFLNPHKLRWAVTLPLALALLAYSNQGFNKEQIVKDYAFTAVQNAINLFTARRLTEILKPGATIGVVWAGTIPYYSGFKAVDFLGKCDPVIARTAPDPGLGWNGIKPMPGHNKYDLNYSIRKLKPTFIQVYRWGRQNLKGYVEKHYVLRENLLLRRNSPFVNWEKLQ